jgi:hypothetical protein
MWLLRDIGVSGASLVAVVEVILGEGTEVLLQDQIHTTSSTYMRGSYLTCFSYPCS